MIHVGCSCKNTKFVKQFCSVLSCDPDATVLHFYKQLLFFILVPGYDLHVTSLRELDGVSYQINQYLFKAPFVTDQDTGKRIRGFVQELEMTVFVACVFEYEIYLLAQKVRPTKIHYEVNCFHWGERLLIQL